jgi:uncharacterized protein YjbI with pentapeptide repeats
MHHPVLERLARVTPSVHRSRVELARSEVCSAAMAEPITILSTLSYLISAGMAAKKAKESLGFDDSDIGAIKSFLDAGTGLARLWSRGKDSRAAALHMAMVTRAFGNALRRYWPGVDMDDVIKRCLERASLQIADPNKDRSDAEIVALLQALSGDPSGNPYYKALWSAFFSAPIDLPGGKEPMDLRGEQPQLFHAYFRSAYLELLATAEGQQVQRWCLGLAAEKREVMRHILAEDLAAWGKRHVFGNVRRQSPGDPMPFLSLDDSYVEPRGKYERKEWPILDLLSRLLGMHKLVVVKADFGHGKSLTARRLARDVARAWLESRHPAGETWYPVVIKCARDLRDARYDHAEIVRSALWHAAEEVMTDRPARHDDAFAPLESERAALFILDGLDEVALTRHHLEDLFRELQAALGPSQRALVLTRPGALHDERCLPKATPVIDLQPFNNVQMAKWVTNWNRLSGKVPVDVARLTALGLATLARTPILLLMIAVTWADQLASANQVSKASLYESFFQHIARGKYEVSGGEEHDAVRKVSRLLARELQRRSILQEESPVEAMLWLMSRVAWEAHSFAYDEAAKDLQARHVAALLDREFGIDDPAMLERIEVGLLLVLQIDPTGASKAILFGHQSFREFLVARYWKHQLMRLASRETRHDQRDEIEEHLMQARLLQHEDEAFSLLIEMLRGLNVKTRRDIKEWARKCLEINDLILYRNPQKYRRPVLWESALAIGSYIEPDEGLELDEWALRFLGFWHKFHEQPVTIRAPGLRSPHAHLREAYLFRATLDGADLKRANLRRAILTRAQLKGADLRAADLEAANLSRAYLGEANLAGVNLRGANLRQANLEGANLQRADLEGADLEGADFERANLQGANLKATSFREANLIETTLAQADLGRANLEGARLEGANLVGANLIGAKLVGAYLRGARVSNAQLASAQSLRARGLDEIDEIPEPE